jgi:hypothetical protein
MFVTHGGPFPRRNSTHRSFKRLKPLYPKLLMENEVVLINWVLIEFESQMESGP